jgi:mevalonate pyrophosphate decarboxylase
MYVNFSDGLVTAPQEHVNKTVSDVINDIDWSNAKTRDMFEAVEKYGLRKSVCRFTTPTGPNIKVSQVIQNHTICA